MKFSTVSLLLICLTFFACEREAPVRELFAEKTFVLSEISLSGNSGTLDLDLGDALLEFGSCPGSGSEAADCQATLHLNGNTFAFDYTASGEADNPFLSLRAANSLAVADDERLLIELITGGYFAATTNEGILLTCDGCTFIYDTLAYSNRTLKLDR